MQDSIDKNKADVDRQFAELLQLLKAQQPPTILPATILRFKEKRNKEKIIRNPLVTQEGQACSKLSYYLFGPVLKCDNVLHLVVVQGLGSNYKRMGNVSRDEVEKEELILTSAVDKGDFTRPILAVKEDLGQKLIDDLDEPLMVLEPDGMINKNEFAVVAPVVAVAPIVVAPIAVAPFVVAPIAVAPVEPSFVPLGRKIKQNQAEQKLGCEICLQEPAQRRTWDPGITQYDVNTLRTREGCEFQTANLRGVLLAGANLQSANLQGKSLFFSLFMITFSNTFDLTNPKFEGAIWKEPSKGYCSSPRWRLDQSERDTWHWRVSVRGVRVSVRGQACMNSCQS
ncbi:hypothetical protein Tco_0921526 [Tanacetum coccineum]